MVPIHNNGDPETNKGISKSMRPHINCLKSLALSMSQQRKQIEMKTTEKATEVEREAYKRLSI